MVSGEFSPGGAGTEWCDAEVLRLLRRRSLAALRREIEPVPPRVLAAFLPRWHQIGGNARGVDAVAATVEQLQGIAGARVGVGAAGAAGPGRRLLARPARRAVRQR